MARSIPVTTHEYDLMIELRRSSDAVHVGDVARLLGMSRPRANSILARWVEFGWFECGPDRFEGRLTPAGRIVPMYSKGNRSTHPPTGVPALPGIHEHI